MNIRLNWLLVGLTLCGLSANGHATIIFTDFSSTAGLTLNGDAVGNVNNGIDASPVLRLAPSVQSQAGSAFTSSLFDVSGFHSTFNFRITNPGGFPDVSGESGADGITFTIQTTGPGALGGDGAGLGYAGIGNSVAIEFDTWNNDPTNFPTINDPNSNHVGIDVDGSMASLVAAAVDSLFDDGNLWYAWIDYDGTTLEVRTNQTGVRPAGANVSMVIDIPTTIGSSTAYVGFTAGTGAAFGDHDIISWQFNRVPEPSTVALMGLGLAGLGFTRRKMKA